MYSTRSRLWIPLMWISLWGMSPVWYPWHHSCFRWVSWHMKTPSYRTLHIVFRRCSSPRINALLYLISSVRRRYFIFVTKILTFFWNISPSGQMKTNQGKTNDSGICLWSPDLWVVRTVTPADVQIRYREPLQETVRPYQWLSYWLHQQCTEPYFYEGIQNLTITPVLLKLYALASKTNRWNPCNHCVTGFQFFIWQSKHELVECFASLFTLRQRRYDHKEAYNFDDSLTTIFVAHFCS